MQANKLETSALLSLFETLQGTTKEEFAREILKRSSFFCDVKFEVDEIAEDNEYESNITFIVTVGPQTSKFIFSNENIKASEIAPLLTGEDTSFIITDCNGITCITVKNKKVTFEVGSMSETLNCSIPYASYSEAFQKFYDWKTNNIIPASTSNVNVISSKFESPILSVTWNSYHLPNNSVTKQWKLQLERLRNTIIQQWECLLSGDAVEINFQASDTFNTMRQVMHGPNAGQMVPWDNFRDHIIRLKADGFDLNELDDEDLEEYLAEKGEVGSFEFISGFYRENGIVNGGTGYLFNLKTMKPAIQSIIEYLKSL